ncbi:MAG TPA: hypothetical protein VH352_01005, partial [Pseudonocardiaceae bacterium]|nr:hypothetical protein [Pseudonocardiaceae bacterium]
DVAPPSTCVPPTITTTATPGNGTIDGLPVVAPGSAQHDVATVNGSGGAGIGTVQFTLCGPAQVATNGGDCSAGGTAVGTAVTLDGSGNASSSIVDGTTTPNDNAAGKYCWRADFTPGPSDHHYTAGTHTNTTTECFTVAHASPTITTVSSANTSGGAAANSVSFTTLGDVATLSGVVSGADLSSQHVTFTLYGPAATAPTSATSCIAAGIASGPVDEPLVNVDATTWKATAPTFTPTSAMGAGYYTWVASYAGDTINSAANGTCTDANETAHLVGPNVSLTKGTPHSTIVAGDQVVYDVNIDNTGAGTAANVVVTDILPVLPSGHTWSLTPTAGYNCTLGTAAGHQVVTCNVGNLNPIALTQIAEVTATTGPLDCPSISNSATLTADPSTLVTAGPVIVTVQCPHLSITKTADAASVNVGSNIGFHVSVTNDGLGTASGVLLSDPLPTGPGINWAIDSATGPLTCSIAASLLTCTGTLAQGEVETVHVLSPTSWTVVNNVTTNSCLGGTDNSGTYDNTATVTATNVIGAPTASASTTVLCPALVFIKTADTASVASNSQIGFVVEAKNTGPGTAVDAVINDPLPSGSGVSWSIDASKTTATGCVITGAVGGQVLACSLGDLATGADVKVHVVSATTTASCQLYTNAATLSADNEAPPLTATATTNVICALPTSASRTPPKPPLAVTGAGPIGPELGWALALFVSGGLALLASSMRRRPRRAH